MARRILGTFASSLLLGIAAGDASQKLSVAVSVFLGISILIDVIIASVNKR